MKICYLASPGVHTYRWLKYFADQGHEVHLITSVENAEINNVAVHQLKRIGATARLVNYPINTIPLILQFKKLIEEIKPDIIHAHYIDDQKILAALSGFHPFVVTAWGSDVLVAPKNSILSRRLTRYVLGKADLITCDAYQVRDALIELGAIPRKIERILFGVDIDKFKPGKECENLPTVVSLRCLEPLYSIEILIKAISIVVKEFPQVLLMLLGSGSQETMLKELAVTLGISNRVVFIGQVSGDDVPIYLTSSDICVSTALSDGGPGGIIEAMACGLPVITTDFGENKNWVKNGVNGFVVTPQNPELLALRIIYLLRNFKLRKKMGKANRRIIVEHNSWLIEMAKMERLYEKL